LSELLAEEYKEQGISLMYLHWVLCKPKCWKKLFQAIKRLYQANEMANYIFDFTLNGNKYFNGKVLQVSSTNP
jgi:hypothetical protein